MTVLRLLCSMFRRGKCSSSWVVCYNDCYCLHITRNMRLFASHIYIEGNVCVDRLTNFGLSMSSFDLFLFDDIHNFIRGEYTRNKLSMFNYRFTTFWKGFGTCPPILSCTFFLNEFMLLNLKKKWFIFKSKKKNHFKKQINSFS